VTADVEERAQLAVPLPDYKYPLRAYLDDLELARVGDVAGPDGAQPLPVEDRTLFACEHRAI